MLEKPARGENARQQKEGAEKRRSRGISVSLEGTHVTGNTPGGDRETTENSSGIHREFIGNSLGTHWKLVGNLSETHRELTGNPTGFYPAVKHGGTHGKTHRKHKTTTLEMPGKHTRKWFS